MSPPADAPSIRVVPPEEETIDPADDVRVGPGEFMPRPDPLVAQGHAEVLLVREYENLLDEVRKRLGDDAVRPVVDAFELAESCHAGQMRKSGDPYLVHPLRVARILAGLGLDVASVVAGILHDTVEDSELTVVELTDRFGREVALLVDGVTKLGKVPYLSRRENQAVSFRKLLVAMSRDIRVLLVKLVDRLDNMRTLDAMPANKQRRIARETADIYAPLARLLGVDWLRRELADLAFRYLEPVAAKTIRTEMVALLTEDPTHIDRGIEMLREAFAGVVVPELPVRGTVGELEVEVEQSELPDWDENLFGPVQFRANVLTAQEVHELRNRGRMIEKLRDMVTYQVITHDRESSYLALGHIHAHFKPIPGSIRDYIALPRANGYQGLHTQVLDRMGVRLYVEIRSQAMNEVAERGVVVDLGKGLRTSELGWLREMMGWQDQVEDPNEFIEAVKRELFADQVFVFTPEGDLKTFGKGATPIDFAFAVHTDVGLHAAGARVNGLVVPLRYRLRQGDTVEILTDPKVEPREEWLNLVQTSRARARIKHYLRQRTRALAVETGKQLLRQRLEAHGLPLETVEEPARLRNVFTRLELDPDQGVDRLYELIGDNQVRIGEVVRAVEPDPDPGSSLVGAAMEGLLRRFRRGRGPTSRPRDGEASAPLVIAAPMLDSGLVELSPCCSPLPGDPIVGFRVPGSGFHVHVEGCPVAVVQIRDRVFLGWDDDLTIERPVTVRVRTENTVGLLAEMSRAFSSTGLNIKRANCRAQEDGKHALNTFHATVESRRQLDELFDQLRDIRGVIQVERVFSGSAAD